MAVPFAKMHGLGNDFVFLDEREIENTVPGKAVLADLRGFGAQLARRLCHRHTGIGADGLIIIRRPTRSDCAVGWMYFNSDGSISLMCGNGLRCVALFARERGWTSETQFNVETAVGPIAIKYANADNITSDLGEPILQSQRVPVGGPARDLVVLEKLSLDAGETATVTCVSMGNPHCVVFETANSGTVEAERTKARARTAELLQSNASFPEGVNVEFVDVLSPTEATVEVWERGCGYTQACASGAAAVLVAGVLAKKLERKATVTLPGGSLRVEWSAANNHVSLTGPARFSFAGAFDLAEYLPEVCA